MSKNFVKAKCSVVSTLLADGSFYILFITVIYISVSEFSLAGGCWVSVCILQNLLRPCGSLFHSRIFRAGKRNKYININFYVCTVHF
jgi:hypothetical protein